MRRLSSVRPCGRTTVAERSTSSVIDGTDLAVYIARVLALIVADIADGRVPATVSTFAELHEHCDANEYAAHAGVPMPPGDLRYVNAVESAADELLRHGAHRDLEGR